MTCNVRLASRFGARAAGATCVVANVDGSGGAIGYASETARGIGLHGVAEGCIRARPPRLGVIEWGSPYHGRKEAQTRILAGAIG